MDAPDSSFIGGHVLPWQERLLRLLRHVILVALALTLWWLVADVLLVIFAGILLAILLRGIARWVCRHTPLPVGLSLVLVVLGIIAIIVGGGFLLVPRTSTELDQLVTQLPADVHRLEAPLQQTNWGRALVEHLQSGSVGGTQAVMGGVFGVASTTVDIVAAFVIAIFIGLYLAAEPGTYLAGALRLAPPPRRPRVAEALHEITRSLRRWLLGRLLSMAIIAVMSSLGLWLLGVQLALILGILAGALAFVPYVGSVSSAIPALLIALTQSPQLALYVLILYVVIHIIEGYVLVPLMQKGLVHLPPALTLGAQAILGSLFGIMGLALATPLAAAIVTGVKMLYVEDTLQDDLARPVIER